MASPVSASVGFAGRCTWPESLEPRPRCTVYGPAVVAGDGRLADRAILRALRRLPGTRLDIRESHGLVLVLADPRGVFSVSGQGQLHLSATVRHWTQLSPGDRVLLVADPVDGLLVVHPPAALDAMVAEVRSVCRRTYRPWERCDATPQLGQAALVVVVVAPDDRRPSGRVEALDSDGAEVGLHCPEWTGGHD
jgi:hypothetical protein